MATATLHLPEVPGYAGISVCWKLDPPAPLGRGSHEFVVQSITESFGPVPARIRVYAATESGAAAGFTLAEMVGSFALRDDYTPGDKAYEDGIRWLSLQHLGGYEVAQ